MSVQPGPTEKRYAANGVSLIYTVPFLVIEAGDLQVYLNGVLVTSGYVHTGIGNPTSTITFTAAPSGDLLLQLNVPFQRLVDYQENGDFLASTVNRDFDRIWQALKQLLRLSGRSPMLGVSDIDGQGQYQAKGNRLSNLADPIADQDASTKGWTSRLIGSILGTITGPINNAANVLFIDRNGLPKVVQDLSANAGQMIGYTAAVSGAVNRSLDSKLSETISVKDFGAVGNGVADDTAAFNAAIAYANARGGDDYANIVGTTIFIPDGRYKITAAVTPINRSGVELVGASRQGTVILMPVGVFGVFTFGSGGVGPTPVGCGFSNAKFEYLTTPNTSSCMFLIDHAFRLQFTNHLWVNVGQAFKFGTSTSRITGGVTLDNITGSCANIASLPVFQLFAGAGLLMTNVALFVAGVLAPVHPAAMTTAANRNVFNCLGGFWDTVLASNCIFERFDYGILIQSGASQVYQNFYYSNCIFDYHKTTVVQLSAAGGVVSTVMMSNCWYVSWEGPAIALTGASYNDNHKFEGKVVIAGQEAVYYAVAGPKSNRFNLEVGAVNRVATSSNSAMWFAPTATGFLVDGCSGNDDTAASGTPWRANYGVVIGANADHYMVCNNRLTGTTGGYSIAANTAASINRRVSGNAAANYSGAVSMSLAGTGVPIYNTTPFTVNVHLYGGTVGGISANGVAIPNMTNGVITLDPGQYVNPTYSSSPQLTAIARA